MKTHLIFSFLIISVMSFGQKPVLEITQEGEDFDFVVMFSELNPEKIPTGILYDKIFLASDIAKYSGKDSNAVCNYDVWYNIYSDIIKSTVKDVKILSISEIHKIIKQTEKNSVIPVLIMNIKYNTIKFNAFDNDLLKFENNKLIDASNINKSPYDEKRVFVASVPIIDLNYPDNTFLFSDD
jgi:predicted glycosyltransferase involved in capsule biosynthesis